MISPDHQSSSQNPKPFRYFSPGKLVFLIQRLSDWGASSEDASQTYEAEIKARLLENPAIQNVEGLSQALQSATLNQRLTLAPDGTGGVLELVSFSGDVDDETLLRFVEAVTDYVTDPSQDEDSAIDIADWLLTLIKAQPAVSDLRVLGLAPNWYFGGAGQADPDQDGTGGPGGQPVPVTFPENAGWQTKDEITSAMPFGFDLSARLAAIAGDFFSRGAGVEVAILDTAPTICDLKRAYGLWHEEHPLLRGLLGPMDSFGVDPATNPHFNVTYAPDEIMLPLNHPRHGLGLRSAGYTMPDHGLFSAGIVHSLAPGAHIRLIQVLNDFGAGTLESITWGLQELSNTTSEVTLPLVVNLSLTMNMPRDSAQHRADDLHWDRLDQAAFNRRMARLFEAILKVVRDRNALVVAAAGNDRRPGTSDENRPIARYPAAFQWVVGVGALNKSITRDTNSGVMIVSTTDYTNLADDPKADGFLIFGGDMRSDKHADPQNGILGMYIADFPDGKLCENGWARWCGTSFATPIISGLLAMLLSRGLANPVSELRASVTEVSALRAANQEQVVLVSQGAPLP